MHDGHMYFYHLLPKDVELTDAGLKSPAYVYNVDKDMILYRKMTDKYRKRLVDSWGIYPDEDPDKLTDQEVYKGINQFRKSDRGNSQIYFFRYPPTASLGPNMKKTLQGKRIVRIDLNDPEVQKCIKSIDWGWEGSNTDNMKLTKKDYMDITPEEYFKDYDDNAAMSFAAINHISVDPTDGNIPLHLLEVADKFVQEADTGDFHEVPLNDENIKQYDNDDFVIGMKHCKTGSKIEGIILLNQDDAAVGYVGVESKSDGKWITALEVAKKYQHQGIGKMLLQCAVDRFGAEKLSVNKDNQEAIELYKKNGWTTFDTTASMYFMRIKNDQKLIKVDDFPFDKVYMGSPYNYTNGAFLNTKGFFITPYKGIASIFTADRDEYNIPKGSCNIGYDEWLKPLDQLKEPLAEVHVRLEGFPDVEPHDVETTGYIYTFDLKALGLEDNIYRYEWMDPEREFLVVISPDQPLDSHLMDRIEFVDKEEHTLMSHIVGDEARTNFDVHQESDSTDNPLDRYEMTEEDIMLGDTKAKMYKWTDNGEPVAQFTVFDWWDGKNIENLLVQEKYRGQGLSYHLLDYATKELGVVNLAVKKDNDIAKHVYDKYGFKVVDEDDDLYYMSIKDADVTQESAASKTVYDRVKELSDFWNTCSYGIPNGDLDRFSEDYWFQSPAEFAKTKKGVCWDFVEYGREFLSMHDVPFHMYFIQTDRLDKMTHTFIVCDDPDGGLIYVESSFDKVAKRIGGYKQFNSLKSIINLIVDEMFEDDAVIHVGTDNHGVMRYDVFEYDGHPKYGCNANGYMKWMDYAATLVRSDKIKGKAHDGYERREDVTQESDEDYKTEGGNITMENAQTELKRPSRFRTDDEDYVQEAFFEAGFNNLRARLSRELTPKFKVSNVQKSMTGAEKFVITHSEGEGPVVNVEGTGSGVKVIARAGLEVYNHGTNVALSTAFNKIIEVMKELFPDYVREFALILEASEDTLSDDTTLTPPPETKLEPPKEEEVDVIAALDMEGDDDDEPAPEDADGDSDDSEDAPPPPELPDAASATDPQNVTPPPAPEAPPVPQKISTGDNIKSAILDDDTPAAPLPTANNEYDEEEVQRLNNLVSSEISAMEEYLNAAKDSKDDTLKKLFADIGSEERFHSEQLLYAKSILTGERYEPRDPEVKKEYEELLGEGMDEDTAAETVADRVRLNGGLDEIDDTELHNDVKVLEYAISQFDALYAMTEAMFDGNKVSKENQAFLEAAFFMEDAIDPTVAGTASKKIELHPIRFIINSFKNLIHIVNALTEKIVIAVKKANIKSRTRVAWIQSHGGIKALFASGVSMYFYDDRAPGQVSVSPLQYADMMYNVLRMIGTSVGMADPGPAQQRILRFMPINITTVDQGIRVIKNLVLTKSKVVVNDQNQEAITNMFFGATTGKTAHTGSSINIYNLLSDMAGELSLFSKKADAYMKVLEGLAANPQSIFYTNAKKYNDVVANTKIVIKGYSVFTKAIAHDLEVIMKLNNGMQEQTEAGDAKTRSEVQKYNKNPDAYQQQNQQANGTVVQ